MGRRIHNEDGSAAENCRPTRGNVQSACVLVCELTNNTRLDESHHWLISHFVDYFSYHTGSGLPQLVVVLLSSLTINRSKYRDTKVIALSIAIIQGSCCQVYFYIWASCSCVFANPVVSWFPVCVCVLGGGEQVSVCTLTHFFRDLERMWTIARNLYGVQTPQKAKH